eukprot:gene18419-biopygen14482
MRNSLAKGIGAPQKAGCHLRWGAAFPLRRRRSRCGGAVGRPRPRQCAITSLGRVRAQAAARRPGAAGCTCACVAAPFSARGTGRGSGEKRRLPHPGCVHSVSYGAPDVSGGVRPAGCACFGSLLLSVARHRSLRCLRCCTPVPQSTPSAPPAKRTGSLCYSIESKKNIRPGSTGTGLFM